jgi:phage-related protein
MNGNSIAFDGHSLQTNNIFTEVISHEDSPTKVMSNYGVAHANASVIPYVGWVYRTITISGTIVGSDIPSTDILIDTFKSWFNGKDRFLDIGYANSTRRYVATATPHVVRPHGLNSATFTVDFFCTQPFGQDTTPTTALNALGRTGASYSDIITFNGSAPYQLPIFTVTYTSLTGGTNATVNFGNNANGQQISLTRNWLPGDVWGVDVTKKQVLVNGTSVDFIGAFPEFPPGPQSMAYSDGFTTRTMNENLIYYPMWS